MFPHTNNQNNWTYLSIMKLFIQNNHSNDLLTMAGIKQTIEQIVMRKYSDNILKLQPSQSAINPV